MGSTQPTLIRISGAHSDRARQENGINRHKLKEQAQVNQTLSESAEIEELLRPKNEIEVQVFFE